MRPYYPYQPSSQQPQQLPSFTPQQPTRQQPLSFSQNQNVPPQQPLPLPPPRDRVMYKSTIQTTYTPITQGGPSFGKLESMGRSIQSEAEEQKKFPPNIAVFQAQAPKPLSFRSDKPERARMASSVIFFHHNTEKSNDTPFGSIRQQHNNGGLSGLQTLAGKARVVHEEHIVDIPEQKRKLQNLNNQPIQNAKNNRQMFKSSIEGQNRVRSDMADLLQPQLQKNGSKKYEFYRNTLPVKNITPEPKPAQQIQRKSPVTVSSSFQNTPTPTPTTQSVPASEASMFKKKQNSFVNTSSNGKTDEDLLKLLGIKVNGGSTEPVASPKVFQKVVLESNIPVKSFQHPTLSQRTSVKAEPPSPSLPVPKISKSDFIVGKKMGKGQFGEVMLVQHKITGFICGMKVMSKKEIKSQKYENQIARQLSIQFYLSHRNVTPLYGYFQDPDNVYLLVEFCTDGQLLQKLRKDRRMEQADVSPIIREICQGLNYIHKEEIIHRDIKPQNILFNYGTVKISDFGWAVHSGNGMRKTISGSPLYYSPEIVQESQYDEKIDIWSIGMMTYECLLGKIPFRIYCEMDLNRIVEDEITFPDYVDVTDQAKDFILKIMKKLPEERMEMREILRHPFITKYAQDRRLSGEVLQELRSVLKL